ncbi:cell division protein FtsZ [Citromicrobium sp. RCC1885]|uniref:cell division protein FtsZ n=1 Tax=unclassified Citromicrobium TaxID=2630544 RepID=UPI0006C91D99|nr:MULTISPECIES: cell division protein FtsZ [unclassified Citromicrobium]KPM23250.1 cell division protein FtsZ [Citromicrobium sp. RCC1885]KPM26657.1 cell division protein FtsZ [Citromicrobium sp. RCC1878]MAO04913.1 cell division protein FtsZ [Citromicrobium sp.]OAM08824.1 cell division protein FtsZ [Citromicrobium sp. RCC1897]|tara:strand:- start:4517 stop:6214 length:1698 start_codon:yes stop_codon:yes gene_type:complete
MSINIGPDPSDDLRPRITVIGVGGAGGNAIANMMEADIEGVDFIVANTDAQSLSTSPAEHRIQLGPESTGGLGAGARPELGKAAAEETVDQIEEALEGVNMCFIAAGMGGGTGTGAAPVIAEAARRKNVLTVGVVTKPFLFEGTRRMRAAEAGIEELQRHVDTLIVIPNQNLFLIAKPETTFKEAFRMADEVLQQGVRSITDLMVMPGLINLDFADVKSVMEEMGKAMMGTGEAEGDNRAREAAEQAIANPLLDGVSMAGAKGVIISIIGGEDMKLLEVDEAANHIRDLVDEDANIIWGSAFNPNLEGKIRVSVVATGIDDGVSSHSASPRSAMASAPEPRPPKRPALDFAERGESDERGGEPQGASPAMPQSFGEPSSGGARMSSDYSEDYHEDGAEDVDGIVDPLAGLRNEDEDDAPAAAPEPSADAPFARPSGERKPFDGNPADDWGSASDDDDTLDLGEAQEAPPRSGDDSDELVLGEDAGEEAPEPEPAPSRGRRRGLVSGEGDAQRKPAPPLPQGGGGGTLFERMAKLSRGGAPEEDDDEDDDGSSLNIPRFLGRQNNQ